MTLIFTLNSIWLKIKLKKSNLNRFERVIFQNNMCEQNECFIKYLGNQDSSRN